MQPKISVIVPVYKAEGYLRRCVDSILAQTFTDFELILIDDCSPDNSGGICDEYARGDNRIKVIHKENGGVASARQCGIDNATGIYSIHADPDDWVEPTMLEELYSKAIKEDVEIVICDFYLDTKENSSYITQEFVKQDSQHVLQELLLHRLHGSLWNKLIKLSCYTDYNIRFIKDLNYCEDYMICVKILMNSVKIAYLNKAFYHYDQIVNDNSITRKYTIDTYRVRCRFIDELKLVLKDKYPEGVLANEAQVAIECLRNNVMKRREYKSIYFKKSLKLLRHIKAKRQKLEFMKAILF